MQKMFGNIIFSGFSQVYWGFLPQVSLLMVKRTGMLLCPEISFVRSEGFIVVYACFGSDLSVSVIRYIAIVGFWFFFPKFKLLLPKY